MSRKLFITRSDHEPTNAYLFAYSEKIIQTALDYGWKVERSEGPDYNSQNLRSRLSNKPCFVVLNGHGNKDEVCGYGNAVAITSGQSSLLSGTVSYIRACDCLIGLGRMAVENGAKAVVGYRGKFTFYHGQRVPRKAAPGPVRRPGIAGIKRCSLEAFEGRHRTAGSRCLRCSHERGTPKDIEQVRALRPGYHPLAHNQRVAPRF
jgi:hypothetical protein